MKKLFITTVLLINSIISNAMSENHGHHSSHGTSQTQSMEHHSHNTEFEKNQNIKFERELLIPPKLEEKNS